MAAFVVTLDPNTFVLDPRVGEPDPVAMSVTAVDRLGVPFTTYVGTIAVDSTDKGMHRPGPYTFTLADHGTHEFPDTADRPGLVPSRAGISLIRVFDVARPSIQGTARLNTTYAPSVGPSAGYYFVHPCGRDPENASDCSGAPPLGDGSHSKPWRQLTYAAKTVPSGSTIIVEVRVDADGNELQSRYGGGVLVNRRLSIVGESILQCQVRGGGADGRAALRILPSGSGSDIHRLTFQATQTQPGKWSGNGIELYGTSAEVTNCFVQANGTGIEINESSSAGPNRLTNNTIVSESGAGVRTRRAHYELFNNIFWNQPCDVYSFVGEPTRVSHIEATLFATDQNLCGSAVPATTRSIVGEARVLQGPRYAGLYVVDLLKPENFQMGVLDGGNGKPDVDETDNDIGSMGGPLGERHYEGSGLTLGSKEPWPLLVAAVLLFAVAALFQRRVGRTRR